MVRRIFRWILLLVLAGSLASTVLTAARIASDPMIAPFIDATQAEIVAATERMLTSAATAETLQAHIANRLNEDPRNWLALDALLDLTTERRIALPTDLLDAVAIAHEDDFSYYSTITSCVACAYDPANCTLNEVVICQGPIISTPLGDISGIVRAGVAYAADEQVDQIDLALSVVGLGATVLVVTSGGSSAVIKAGAGLAKLAHKMGRLSPKLADLALHAATRGIDWARLPAVRTVDDLTSAIHAEAFVPLVDTVTDLNRLGNATNITTALHLLPMVDDAADARKLARAAEALGPKTVGRAEVLGKSRLFRATVRISNTALALLVELNLLFLSLAGLAVHALQTVMLRHLRRRVRGPVDRPADVA